MRLKVTFSIDPTGLEMDITREVVLEKNVCLYCFHDKENRIYDEVKKALENQGYELNYYFQLLKVYAI